MSWEGFEKQTNFRDSRKSRKPQERLSLTLALIRVATGPEGHRDILAAVPALLSKRPLSPEQDPVRGQTPPAHSPAGHACPQGPFTFLLPPPGTWLMLSRDPIFDCTLSLKSSFSDFTSTWPPPAREEWEVGQEQHPALQGSLGCSSHCLSSPPAPSTPAVSSQGQHSPRGTWFVMDVAQGTTFGCHMAQVDWLVNDLHLPIGERERGSAGGQHRQVGRGSTTHSGT